MTPGFHVESVPDDIVGSPAIRTCDTLSAMFARDERLSGNITLAVTPQGPRDLWISMIHANLRGTGTASRLLDATCLLCDMHGVVLRLLAISLKSSLKTPEGALDRDALRDFYGRRGFVADPAGRDEGMIRRPALPCGEGADARDRMRTARNDRRRSKS